MKRLNSITTKCVDNLLYNSNKRCIRSSASSTNKFAPFLSLSQQRWSHSNTAAAESLSSSPCMSWIARQNCDKTELTNRKDSTNSLHATQSNESDSKENNQKRAESSQNREKVEKVEKAGKDELHAAISPTAKLTKMTGKRGKTSNKRLQLSGSRRLPYGSARRFNTQSYSASPIASTSEEEGEVSLEDDSVTGAHLRDLGTLRSSLGVTLGSKIYIWGQSSGTSMGFDKENNYDSALPLLLDSISDNGGGYRDISVGTNHTGVVTSKGDLYMFGASKYGELGIGEDLSQSTVSSSFVQYEPTKVEGIENVVKVSCGSRHTAAITASGELYTWGWGGGSWMFGGVGGLGHGNKESINYPKKVKFNGSSTFIIDVSCGDKHTLALTSDGRAYAMGEGEHGRLGTGSTSNCKSPVLLEYFNDIELSHIYAAKEYSFALSCRDGIPIGWGRNDRNQMGQGGGLAMDVYSCDPTPGPINLQNVIGMDLSQSDVIAVTMDGTVYYWGDRVYLEPNSITSEKFQEEEPIGNINNVGVSQTGMFFITDEGELFSCNKTLGMRSDVFTLGHGAVSPFKIAKRVEALQDEKVKKICASDQRTAVIVE